MAFFFFFFYGRAPNAGGGTRGATPSTLWEPLAWRCLITDLTKHLPISTETQKRSLLAKGFTGPAERRGGRAGAKKRFPAAPLGVAHRNGNARVPPARPSLPSPFLPYPTCHSKPLLAAVFFHSRLPERDRGEKKSSTGPRGLMLSAGDAAVRVG